MKTNSRRAAHFNAISERYNISGSNLAGFIRSAYYYEKVLNFYAIWECNGRDSWGRPYTEEVEKAREATEKRALKRLTSLCGNKEKAIAEFRTNRDPRGYMLKFEPCNRYEVASSINMDWGGYICIAPDFNEAI